LSPAIHQNYCFRFFFHHLIIECLLDIFALFTAWSTFPDFRYGFLYRLSLTDLLLYVFCNICRPFLAKHGLSERLQQHRQQVRVMEEIGMDAK